MRRKGDKKEYISLRGAFLKLYILFCRICAFKEIVREGVFVIPGMLFIIRADILVKRIVEQSDGAVSPGIGVMYLYFSIGDGDKENSWTAKNKRNIRIDTDIVAGQCKGLAFCNHIGVGFIKLISYFNGNVIGTLIDISIGSAVRIFNDSAA